MFTAFTGCFDFEVCSVGDFFYIYIWLPRLDLRHGSGSGSGSGVGVGIGSGISGSLLLEQAPRVSAIVARRGEI